VEGGILIGHLQVQIRHDLDRHSCSVRASSGSSVQTRRLHKCLPVAA
jgi:hypothetical protein